MISNPHRDRVPLLLAIVCFVALSLMASITSHGFSEADGCTHYLYARYAFQEPYYFVNVWGRPLVTAIYSVPAVLGNRFGVRTASLILALGCALVARSIAAAMGDRRPTLAAIFTLAQPLVFLHSFSELTELPFALLLGLAFWAFVRQRWFAMACLIALSPLARPEGFGLLLLAALVLVLERRWALLLILPIPLIGWDIAGWVLYGYPTYPGVAEHLPFFLRWVSWIGRNWPYSEESAYASGSAWHFVMLMPAVASPLIFPATCIGVWRSFRGTLRDHLNRCRWLCAIVPLGILLVHSYLYFAGKMASSGELRYMIVVAPFWGILSARGWSWLAERLRFERFPLLLAGLISLTPIVANHYYRVVPLVYSPDWLQAEQVADWLRSTPLHTDYSKLLISHPGVFYFLGVSPTQHDRSLEWSRGNVDHPLAGVILIWDSTYALNNSDQTRIISLDEIHRAGWTEHPLPGLPAIWHVFLSPSVAAAPAFPRSRQNPGSGLPSTSAP